MKTNNYKLKEPDTLKSKALSDKIYSTINDILSCVNNNIPPVDVYYTRKQLFKELNQQWSKDITHRILIGNKNSNILITKLSNCSIENFFRDEFDFYVSHKTFKPMNFSLDKIKKVIRFELALMLMKYEEVYRFEIDFGVFLIIFKYFDLRSFNVSKDLLETKMGWSFDYSTIVDIFNYIQCLKFEDMVYEFMSTSKVTFSGAGVAVLCASEGNIQFLLKQMGVQTLGYDKMNQLRHIKFFKTPDGLKDHMRKQADYLRPKFDCALVALERRLGGFGIGNWTHPNGGYFISYDGLPGTAKRCIQLCKEAGVQFTDAGSCFPYGIDPEDKNIRIAPSYPTTEQLYQSMRVFCLSQKIAALEMLMAKDN